jgi:uncharacterized protein YbjT (DUF2867 family)
MTKVAIVGAHGQIGQLIIRQLVAQGDQPVGIVRKPEQIERITSLGGHAILLDIENATAEQLATALQGIDAVVFAAGAGAGSTAARKRTVDYAGSVLLAQAAQLAGITRYVQISAMGVDNPLVEEADEVWTAYVAAKRDADSELRSSGLDWTIIRPGPLSNAAATGKVTLGNDVGRGEIPREDVAALVIASLAEDKTIGQQWEARSGETPLREAIIQQSASSM